MLAAAADTNRAAAYSPASAATRTTANLISRSRASAQDKTNAARRTISSSGPIRGFGGAEGIRTPDLCIANATLYQLSYSPVAAAGHAIDSERLGKGPASQENCGPERARATTCHRGTLCWLPRRQARPRWPGSRQRRPQMSQRPRASDESLNARCHGFRSPRAPDRRRRRTPDHVAARRGEDFGRSPPTWAQDPRHDEPIGPLPWRITRQSNR